MTARRMHVPASIVALALLGGCAAPSVAEPTPSVSADVPYHDEIPLEAIAMEVVEVVDGDTLRLRTDAPGDLVTTTRPIAVRLIGIDAPEVHPHTECHGPEATEALEWWAPAGSEVRVAADVDSWDRYDRRLFYLWTADGSFVNEALVAEGFAEAIRVEPNTARFGDLRAAEADAIDAGAGIWGECAGG